MNRLPSLLALCLAAACSSPQPAPVVANSPGQVAPAWTMFRGDPARDGHPFGVTLTPASAARLGVAWQAELGSPVAGGLVVAAGIVVAGTLSGTLYAFSTEQGEQLWKQAGLGPLAGQPLIWGTSVYAGTSDGRLFAFDLLTGNPLWDWRSPGRQPAIWGGPVVFGGLLVLGIGSQPGDVPQEPGRLVALDPASGDRVWAACVRADCPAGDAVSSSVAVDPQGFGFVGVGSPDDAVVRLDLGLGRVAWTTSLFADQGRGLDVGATPLLFLQRGEELVAAGGQDGTFAVLHARTGAVAWSRKLVAGGAAGGLSGSPGFDGRALYVPSAGSPSGLFALSPGDGATLWVAASARPVSSSPAVGLGVLVYGEGDGLSDPAKGAVIALSTVDGHELWRHEAGAAVVASPALAGAAVFAADRHGTLMAFRPV